MMPDVVAMCRLCVDLERVPVKDSGFFVDCNEPDEANNISQTTHNVTKCQVSIDWPRHTKFRSLKLIIRKFNTDCVFGLFELLLQDVGASCDCYMGGGTRDVVATRFAGEVVIR